jgi:CHASE2 domain-containing sensor protein/anti-sigma regulatory factor (Ser/Thr protein kinase)
MRLRRRTLAEWSLLMLLLTTVSGLAAWQGWLWRADHLLYDVGLALAKRPPPDDIVIVAIDEESLARIGRWPWRRGIHATLIERLTEAGATAVGMDIILTEPATDDPRADHVLADAIRRNGRVALPVVARSSGTGLSAEGRPTPQFANAAAALGHIEMELDADGIARSLYLWGGAGQPRHPQLGLAVLQVGAPELAARFSPGKSPAGAPDADSAWRRDSWTHLQFAGPPGTYRTVSYVDVLTGETPAEALRGKFVLIGATAAGLGDIYPTPMSELGRPMPGVEIHATVIDALRSGEIVKWASPQTVVAITMFTVVALMVGLLYLSPRDGLVLSAVLGLALVLGIVLLLDWGRFWLPPSAMLIGIVLAYPLWSWRRLEAAQRFIDFELRQLRDADPGATDNVPTTRSIDPLEDRINIVRGVADRQRAIRKSREDTMRFISHDIRSPLASIITLTDGLGDASRDDPHLRQIGRYAQHALDLADDFFRLAKAEALDPRGFREVDMASLAQDAADDVWPIAEKRRITVSVEEGNAEGACVLGDQMQLLRALVNLLNNAIKFSPEGSLVRVSLNADGDWLEVTVTDQGCGIAEENLGKIFTRYGRITEAGQPSPPGVGLGLLIVKTIVERHGGAVAVHSVFGKGSTFTIRLPRSASRHD